MGNNVILVCSFLSKISGYGSALAPTRKQDSQLLGTCHAKPTPPLPRAWLEPCLQDPSESPEGMCGICLIMREISSLQRPPSLHAWLCYLTVPQGPV